MQLYTDVYALRARIQTMEDDLDRFWPQRQIDVVVALRARTKAVVHEQGRPFGQRDTIGG